MANGILQQNLSDNKIQVNNIKESTFQELVNEIIDPIRVKMIKYCYLITKKCTKETWNKSSANEFGCLMNGLQLVIKGTQKMHFIAADKFTKVHQVTYERFC